MDLRRYLQTCKNNIALLYTTDTCIECKEYNVNQFNDIPIEFLNMEIMDINYEEDCTELWVL